jgi:hypothetical protein
MPQLLPLKGSAQSGRKIASLVQKMCKMSNHHMVKMRESGKWSIHVFSRVIEILIRIRSIRLAGPWL